jgi:hypothetical protein
VPKLVPNGFVSLSTCNNEVSNAMTPIAESTNLLPSKIFDRERTGRSPYCVAFHRETRYRIRGIRSCNLIHYICLRIHTRLTHSPTKSSPIFPPSHNAQDLPRHVSRCTRGPSVAPLWERVWRTSGTWFVMRPRARNGTNKRGGVKFFWVDALGSLRGRLRGGPAVFSISMDCAAILVYNITAARSGEGQPDWPMQSSIAARLMQNSRSTT